MKITFIAPAHKFSGGAKVIAIYAERLKRRGHTVVVVAPPTPGMSLRSRVKKLISQREWRSEVPKRTHFDGRDVDLRIYSRRFRPVENRDVPDADVLIATWYKTAFEAARLAPEKGARVLFIQGYETLPELPVPEIDDAWRLPFQKIVISRWLKQLAIDKFGDTQAVHVPNSVDQQQFFAPERAKNATPTLGFLASTSPFKGLHTALAALELIRARIPNLRVVTFGQERLGPDMRLPPDVEFTLLPPQDAIRDLYARCDLWLCASQREGFHLPPLEAMACRCPVVSTRVGGPEDIIEPGVNGYLVEPHDAAGLAREACRVLELGPDEWRRFSDAAYATACRFTWDQAAVNFEKALELAVARAERGEIAGGTRK